MIVWKYDDSVLIRRKCSGTTHKSRFERISDRWPLIAHFFCSITSVDPGTIGNNYWFDAFVREPSISLP
jgi:hypothetical protein